MLKFCNSLFQLKAFEIFTHCFLFNSLRFRVCPAMFFFTKLKILFALNLGKHLQEIFLTPQLLFCSSLTQNFLQSTGARIISLKCAESVSKKGFGKWEKPIKIGCRRPPFELCSNLSLLPSLISFGIDSTPYHLIKKQEYVWLRNAIKIARTEEAFWTTVLFFPLFVCSYHLYECQRWLLSSNLPGLFLDLNRGLR